VEVDDTSLSLRAYEPGDYTFALFSQEIGDGMMGGGRDDDIPLMSLLDTERCDYGGGRDDDVPLYYFFGIADYTSGSWRWFGPYSEGGPTLEVYTSDLKNRFKSPSDRYYVVFLTTSPGRSASQLPREGVIAPLPFDPEGRSASQGEEAPGGVRINRLVTDAEAGHATIPSIVTGLQAAVDGSSVALDWDANPDPDVLLHRIYRRDVALGPDFTLLDEVDTPTLTYEDMTAVTDTTYVYGVVAVNDVGAGGRGEVGAGPPLILGVTPTSGMTGGTATFRAALFGSAPFAIEWGFGGGATPDSTTEASPQVTLSDPGDYFAWVMADNALGHDSIDFVLTVNGPPGMWHIQVATSFPAEMIANVSLAEVNGNPAISYDDWSGRDLMYVRATSPDGSSWGTPVTVDSVGDVGLDCRMVVVNGNPAISYYDSTNGCLKYVRATDADGSSWGTPVVVWGGGSTGTHSSLAVVNGSPAVAFHDSGYDALWYAQATDINGASWGMPVTADGTIGVGWYTSIAFVNFAPAIAYYDHNLENLMYVRATDPNGASWGSPVIADGVGDDGYEGISMAMVYIYPAISYPDSYPNDDLKFVRATSFDGSTWGTPVTVDSAGDVGDWSSLAIVNGRPAISYMDWTDENLNYVRALDPYGDAWGTPVAIDGPSVAQMSSLTEINDCPAIAYCDWSTGELKFAICY
jgi:hypothetical protein